MPVEVMLCYARQDERFLRQLEAHLTPLQVQGLVNIWNERHILGGTAREPEISQHLNTADVILLLISADFMASDYCYSTDMQRALERHEQGEAYVIPIIMRPTLWQGGPFRKLQVLPADSRPLSMWSDLDGALSSLAQSIEQIIREILAVQQSIEFSIEQGDITSFNADVLALKYAQEFYGTDGLVADLLDTIGTGLETLRPAIGNYRYVQTQNCIQAHHALFVGVPDLINFEYQEIQDFAAQVLNILATIAPATEHLVMTIHGANFGLDEIEAFLSQCRGYIQAIQDERFPLKLEKITIIDIDRERVKRLQQAFEELFSTSFTANRRKQGSYYLSKQRPGATSQQQQPDSKTLDRRRIAPEKKSHVFVAMPFKKEMDDVFYYGIQQPVRAAGFICERVDQEAFIGDILDQVKNKIETAAVVIAELSGANPNVYLEVGYAWGKGRPTILLTKDEQELRFDVRGQRCLKYERIQDLEEFLKKELQELHSKGII